VRGTIKSVIKKQEGKPHKGGFGFIIDEHGEERFFHANNLVKGSPRFEDLKEGSPVEFEPVTNTGGKHGGLRAESVRVCA
jgi:cold shock CspA family protein